MGQLIIIIGILEMVLFQILINTSHVYNYIGKYTISLIVSDGFTYDTSYKVITVINDIKIDFEADIKNGDIPLNVKFLNYTEGDNLNYSWDFGDGQKSIEHNPSHTYSQYGVWNVSLTTSNEYLNKTLTKSGFITTKKVSNEVNLNSNFSSLFDIKRDLIYINSKIDNIIIYNILGEEICHFIPLNQTLNLTEFGVN